MHGDKEIKFSLPRREEEILKFWEENRIFEKSLQKNKNGKEFVFYEGPPTANGSPGIHHLEARAFKDLIPRYKTMQGFFVPRRAGWDTHGLPVEIQVEKELGLKNKQDIERYGIAPFNAKAKESVWKYKEEWDRLTRRMGFWLDLKHPYITYDPLYMESLWWIIKEFWKKKLLYEDFKVVPWCTRCQTGLSSHEVGQGYKEITDTAVFVKFKVKSLKFNVATQSEKLIKVLAEGKPVYILAWTTTPWTLPGNVGLAVNPKLDYLLIDHISELYIVAKDALGKGIRFDALAELAPDFANVLTGEKKLSDSYYLEGMMKGSELLNFSYEPLFSISSFQKSDRSYKIYPADFVTAEDGTGVVHTAVMYGEDDYKLGKKIGLPAMHTVTEAGKFTDEMGPELAGKYVKAKETENEILRILGDAVLKKESYTHEYPHCWRCETPLLYYARKAWWVRTTEVKKQLLANNESIKWVPEHLKKGRFGEFLKDVRDWAFSRERYWGTPLPVWRCADCGAIEVIGSINELREKSPPARNRYFMMRHGESLSNIKGITSSKGEGHHLTLKGRKQVEAAVKKIKKQKIDMIVCSPILRARETAEIAAKIFRVPIHTESRLAEINVGALDGKAGKDYHAFFSSTEEKFTKRPPEGEHLGDVRARMLDWMQETEKKHHGKTILVVSHEYPLWMMQSGACGLTNSETIALRTGKRKEDFIALAEIMQGEYVSLPRDETGEINLHRPFVDQFSFSCAACKKGTAKRVPEVVDVWFDSGAMPFAQVHYPFGKEKLSFPADYIAEAIDQTRGWFYTLLAVSTLLGKSAPYKNVISLGHVLDRNGQKMSKSKPNMVNPREMIEKYGVDALRWYFYTINSPGDPKRFDEKDIANKLRGFLMTFWNSFLLFDTYVDKLKIGNEGGGHILDRWLGARLDALTKEVTDSLDRYDIVAAARAVEEFTINDFSQWYLRRSRRRFQQPKTKEEKYEVAEATASALIRLCALSAPFIPFFAEAIWQELRVKLGLKEQSVHLAKWPEVKKKILEDDSQLFYSMATARKFATEALHLRAEAGIKVRQPLASLEMPRVTDEVAELIREEINVKKIIFGKELKLDTLITPELKAEGIARDFIRNVQEMRRDLGLKPKDRARIQIAGDGQWEEVLMRWQKIILKETHAEALTIGGKKQFKIEREFSVDGVTLWIGLL